VSTPSPDPPSGVQLASKEAVASSLVCPRCDVSLFRGSAHGVLLNGCGLCGGIWIDNASASRAMKSYDRAVVTMASTAGRHATTQPERSASVRCAECRAPTQRVKVSRHQIPVDYCELHGTWFDKGELTTVLESLRSVPAAQAVMIDARPLSPAEIPDFRAGQPTDYASAGLVAGGIFAVLGGMCAIAGSD
jgi:Zn-finger nucleic acid-binding protein